MFKEIKREFKQTGSIKKKFTHLTFKRERFYMAKPTGQEMVVIFREEQNPISLAEKMDNFVNNFTADLDGFVDALKKEDESLKVRFATISLFWIKKMNKYLEQDWFDLRNQYSIETSDKIRKILGESLENFHPEYTGYLDPYYREEEEDQPFEVEFVEKMARTHRTLQQTFSGLVFHWLSVMQDSMENEFFVGVSQKISQGTEKDFHGTPMI
jgi:hypothetical protein